MMIVGRHMVGRDELTVINLEMTLKEVLEHITDKSQLSLPVMDKDKFIGIVYKEQIYEGLIDSGISREDYLEKTVEEVYTTDLVGVESSDLLETASKLLEDAEQAFLPVYNNSEFVGIITHTAIFKVYSKILGEGQGTRISLRTANISGRLVILAKEIYKLGGNIITLAVDDIDIFGVSRIIVRVNNCDIEELVKNIKQKGFKTERVD